MKHLIICYIQLNLTSDTTEPINKLIDTLESNCHFIIIQLSTLDF